MGFTKIYLFDESNGHFLICELFRIDVFFFVALVFLCDIKSAYLPN